MIRLVFVKHDFSCRMQETQGWKGAGEPAGKLPEEKWMSAGASGFLNLVAGKFPSTTFLLYKIARRRERES